MSELILHHYEGSPYAEKIRLILGYKRLAWRSVAIPPILPRPLLEPLVGAYRRTPVLQVGADLYCDTRCIAAFLERAFPSPTLFPAESRALSYAITRWVEPRVFVVMAPLRFRRPGEMTGFMGRNVDAVAFAADRAPFMRGALDLARIGELEAAAFDQVNAFLATLACALRDSGGPYLAGAAASLADFAAGHLVWWLDRAPRVCDVLDPRPELCAWFERLRAIGHGDAKPMTAAEALARAHDAEEPLDSSHPATDAYGRGPGRRVRVSADDYGKDVVEGQLCALDEDEIVIRREHPEVGSVRVHFPRIGFEILPA